MVLSEDGPGFCMTDGPWHMHDMESATVCGPDHIPIADCNARSRLAGENEANARAVMAVPAMLEALEAAESILRYAPQINTNVGGARPTMTTSGALRLVREALDRAVLLTA